MAINLIAINPYVIHCSKPYSFIKCHGNLYINFFDCGHDTICVTDCQPDLPASQSLVLTLLSRMTPRASGRAAALFFRTYNTQSVMTLKIYVLNEDIETSLLQKKP